MARFEGEGVRGVALLEHEARNYAFFAIILILILIAAGLRLA